ncbi:hypothetical protein DLAC_02654 [Tieghemostelium lacteum]|uniref:Uncharacterized protein n=1 Tax=Tieghemostelium lacteum TaxID=361077 RepID=A0A152A305_TIELA|nr:hypothetical protein DLAC_02654 [Tieghemostelium lacteum]|eukprot:KYR00628.1 hypothetical protein DLAC_02654 [Tieghemostelium lacteum]
MNFVFVYIDKNTSIVVPEFPYLGQVEDFVYSHHKFISHFRPNNESIRLKLVSYVDGKYDKNQILPSEKEIKDLDKDIDGKTRLFTIVSTAVPTITDTQLQGFFPTRFSTNGAIGIHERNTKYFYLERDNTSFRDKILQGDYILFHGTRSSGKTTKVIDIMEKLTQQNYIPVYTSLEHYTLNSEDFWKRFVREINRCINGTFTSDDVPYIFDKQNVLAKKFFLGKKVVLFIDEFDRILAAPEEVKIGFLGQLRSWKPFDSYLKSVVAIGPFDILFIDKIHPIQPHSINAPKSRKYSPFNVIDQIATNDFTLEEVKKLFKLYQDDHACTVDPKIVENIFDLTNGHAGLVNLCGRAVDEGMNHFDKNFSDWSELVSSSLIQQVLGYSTVTRIMSDLEIDSPQYKERLLEHIRSFPKPLIVDTKLGDADRYWISIGILNYQLKAGSELVIISQCAIKSQLLYYCLLANIRTICNRKVPPKSRKNTEFDIIQMVETLTPFFTLNGNLSTKNYRGFGTGPKKDTLVPSEAFYHFELVTLIKIWDPPMHIFPNARTSSTKTDRADILLEIVGKKCILEIVAHSTLNQVSEHINRCSEYKKAAGALEAWVLHYTMGKENETVKYPTSISGVGVIHIWHNADFSEYQCFAYPPKP